MGEVTLKRGAKMRLALIPTFQRNIQNTQIRAGQQRGRSIHSDFNQVAVRSDTDPFLEEPHEVEAAYPCFFGKPIQRQWLFIVGVNILQDICQAAAS